MYNRFQDYINRNRRQNTLEAQARAEADSRRREARVCSPSHHASQQSPSRSFSQHHPSQSSVSTFDDCFNVIEQSSSPLQSPLRNQTSLSYGSTQSNEDEEEEEEMDQFDMNAQLGHECFRFDTHHTPPARSVSTTLEVPSQPNLPQMFYLSINSCEGGKQLRSASFDGQILLGGRGSNTSLDLPEGYRNTRSRSFDYAHAGKQDSFDDTPTPTGSPSKVPTVEVSCSSSQQTTRKARPQRTDSTTSHGSTSFLDIPKWKLIIRRPSSNSNTDSGTNTPDTMLKDCIHCVYINELYNQHSSHSPTLSDSVDSDNSSYNEDDDNDNAHYGEAHYDNQTTFNNLQLPTISIRPDPNDAIDEYPDDEYIEPIEGLPIVTLCPPEVDSQLTNEEDEGSGITVVSLEVPVLSSSKQGRSASVDSPYLLQVPQRTDIEVREGPPKARSKSVDIVLPTTIGGSYMPVIVSSRPPAMTTKKAIQGEIKIQAENGEVRILRSAPDWTDAAINGDHIWMSSSASGSDLCYVGEQLCTKTGPRLCCTACKVTAHTGCISTLIDKMKFQCKLTFKDGVRQLRETNVKHHFVHRRHEKGRCATCGKAFQSKLSFGNKEVVAVSCSWCKLAYHNKETCFQKTLLEDTCNLANYREIVVPPSWIVKLPRKGSFKSSIRRAPRNKRLSSKKRSKKELYFPSVADSSPSLNNQLDSHSSSSLMSSSTNSNFVIDHSLSSSKVFPLQQQQQQAPSQSSSPEDGETNCLQPNGSTFHSKGSSSISSSSTSTITSNNSFGGQGLLQQSCSKSELSFAGRRHTQRRHSHTTVGASKAAFLTAGEGKENSAHMFHHICRSFAIKPIPSPDSKPLLVFINPKSGGNQGAKLMQKFQWHLNPRQVFDLSQGGPRLALELYRKVYNLRILACGGDGTVGWVLSAIDEIGLQPPPPISVLPLGTGNDLSQSLGWGASYTDEPISKILCNNKDGEVVQLDRWNLKVKPNELAMHNFTLEDRQGAKPSLPLNVVNNYFSIGVDAHIALSFHEAREAHPERFNSRIRNKMFYGIGGTRDLVMRKWKDLHKAIELECDGVSYTDKLRDPKMLAVLFLNIPSYGGGTRPWPLSQGERPPSMDDGYIEVIGFTAFQLSLLQAGGRGTPITQCKQAKIITSKTIPMQVDGEPCRLLPSIIQLEFRNKANLIAKTKSILKEESKRPTLESVTLKVRKLNLNDYETYHYDKDRLKEISTLLGTITIEQNRELVYLRSIINALLKEKGFCVVGGIETASSKTIDLMHQHQRRQQQQQYQQHQQHQPTSSTTTSIDNPGEDVVLVCDMSTLTTTTTTKLPPDSTVCLPSTSYHASSSTSSSNKFVSRDWCFVDSCTAERFFRIDKAQEHLHYVVDICNEDIYILDPQFEKEDIDLFTSEEMIADVVGRSVGSIDLDTPKAVRKNDATASVDTVGGILALDDLSVDLECAQLDYYSKQRAPNCLSEKPSLPLKGDDNRLTPECSDGGAHQHQVLSPSSPLLMDTNSADSPPRSPRRHRKMGNSMFSMSQLVTAAQRGNVPELKELHHQGVNLMMIDEKGMTALHHAVMFGHEQAVAFLMKLFSKNEMLNVADPTDGHTALHKAVLGGHSNICAMLTSGGARTDIKDHHGRSAEDLAVLLGFTELAAVLTHIEKADNRETVV